ncbi:MAG: cytochrome c-type biosis protein [Actinomycetota bacterium]|nr:cytochrome c-type biosis protein [Actinomycetota bacterium]
MLTPVLAIDASGGIGSWWAPFLAFAAGTVSFASPCVLPLVPGYLSFIAGGRAEEDDRRRVAPILLFIAGFGIIFVALGVSASLIPILRGDDRWGQRISGGIVVIVGVLMVAYAVRIGGVGLYRERRPFLERIRPGRVGALGLGMAFAAGWTPCIGPVLGAILTLARNGGTVRAVVLLSLYSLGLGLPFLLIGLGVQRFMGAYGWIKRNYRWIGGVSGVLLVGIGILLMTGQFTRWFAPLQRYLPGL